MVNITKVSFLVVLFYNKLYLMCVSSYIESPIGSFENRPKKERSRGESSGRRGGLLLP